MGNFYVYLIASLPSLTFGSKPPLSFDGFLKACAELIPDEDIALLKSIPDGDIASQETDNRMLKKWTGFDNALRNELVKIRALHMKKDPVKYLREDISPDSAYTSHLALNAYRKPSPLEGEKALDLDRWMYLEEMSIGHYFDLDILVIYACKLLMLEKWSRIQSAQPQKMLEEVLA